MNTAIYWKEAKYEFLKRLRVRVFLLATVGLPLMFYVVFGILMNQTFGGMHMSTYALAPLGVFGVASVCLFGFGVNLAIERGLGWLELKQASPMPPAAYFIAKLVAYTLFSIILIALMFALGFGFGHVQLSALDTLHLFAVLLAGAIPFGALGLVLGYLAGASSASGLINMIFLPMAFCSGLWTPLQFLPKTIREIAPFLPTYHASQLAIAAVHGDRSGGALAHWGALAGFTLLFLGLAALLHRRDATRQNRVG